MIPEKFGKYLIDKGDIPRKGGYAQVWRGTHPDIGEPVAIKVPLHDDQNYRNAFETEARRTWQLRDSNIVRVYDAGLDEELATPFIVMEFLPGSLARILKDKKRLPWLEAAKYAIDVCKALNYTHRHRKLGELIHTDIKPENLMISEEGELRVCDFGLALAVKAASGRNRIGLYGTPAYMPPEQWTDGKLDPRSDVYALGITLFELVTGEKPYSHRNPYLLGKAHEYGEFPDIPSDLGVPPELNSIVSTATNKQPYARFQTAEHMKAALENLLGRDRIGFGGSGPKPDPHLRQVIEQTTKTLQDLHGKLSEILRSESNDILEGLDTIESVQTSIHELPLPSSLFQDSHVGSAITLSPTEPPDYSGLSTVTEDFHRVLRYVEPVSSRMHSLQTLLQELELPTRVLNSLQHADIFTLGRILAMSHVELLNIRNFGQKSLVDLTEMLMELHVDLMGANVKADIQEWLLINPDLLGELGEMAREDWHAGDYGPAERRIRLAIRQDPSDEYKFWLLGEILTDAGDLPSAIEAFSEAIRLHPTDEFNYWSRSRVYIDMERLDLALDDLDHAIVLNPQVAEFFYRRGLIGNQLNNFEMASDDFSSAIQLDPDDSDTWASRSISHLSLGLHQQAIEDLSQAIGLEQYAQFYRMRGDIYSELEDYGNAIQDHTRAIDLAPEDAHLHIHRGADFTAQNRYEEALEDYNQATILDPSVADHFGKRGSAYLDLEEFSLAILDFEEVLRIEPNSIQALLCLALADSKQNRVGAAVLNCMKARSINPEDPLPLRLLGTLLLEQENYEQAVSWATEAIALAPNAQAYRIRGDAYFGNGDYELAIEDYSTALDLEPAFGLTYKARGLSLLLIGENVGAIEDFLRALEYDPQDADSYRYRGFAYFEDESNEFAIRDFDEALSLGSTDVQVYRCRGQAYFEGGEFQRAIDDYDQVIAMDENDGAAYQHRGLSRSVLEEYPGAISDFSKSIEFGQSESLVPEWRTRISYTLAASFEGRAIAYLQSHIYAESIADLSEVIRITGNMTGHIDIADVYGLRAKAYLATEEYNSAIGDLNLAIELDPGNYMFHMDRGRISTTINKFEAAIVDFDIALNLGSDDDRSLVYLYRADANIRLGRYGEALWDYNMVLDLEPESIEVYSPRAKANYEVGEFFAAVRDCYTALHFNPENEEASQFLEVLSIDSRFDQVDRYRLLFDSLGEHVPQTSAVIAKERAALVADTYGPITSLATQSNLFQEYESSEVFDSLLDRKVTIMFGPRWLANDSLLSEAVDREIVLMAGYAHPNIASISDTFADSTSRYIVSEFLDANLKSHMTQTGPFNPDVASRIVVQVCGALGYVSSRQFPANLLPDPENIYLDEQGTAKVWALGFVATADTPVFGVNGNPEYVAPEIWNGGPTDVRSGIYSLGVTLYEMLTGEVPFPLTRIGDLARDHAESDVPSIGESLNVASGLEAIVRRALAKRPEDRFQTPDEMRDALRDYLETGAFAS